jgi:type IV pilus assembly protein PilB
MMRADPDIIMVGEIRDRETAQISIEAALTGHLVLSTLHTNDAPSAITRLVEMGIEPFLLASSVRCVVAQRLARVLCTSCKRPTRLEAAVLTRSGFMADADFDAYEAVGCARCSSGFRGRIGVYEIMPMSDAIRELTLHSASANRIMDAARSEGMRTLREDAFLKVREGVTSIDEVMRVLGT